MCSGTEPKSKLLNYTTTSKGRYSTLDTPATHTSKKKLLDDHGSN